MKKVIYLIISFFIFILLFGCITTPSPPGNPIVIQRVVEADYTKDEFFRLSNEWLTKTFRSSKSVIQYQDKEEGIIIGKGFTPIRMGLVPIDAWFTIKIENKENKSRITINDLYGSQYIEGREQTFYYEQSDRDRAEAERELNIIVDDYEKFILSEVEEW